MASAAQAKAFIKQIAPIVQKYAKLYGYEVASPVIAQACIESAFGTSALGYKYHNYFGMKCGSKWRGKSVNLSTKEEYTVGQLTNIKANFRVYDSMDEGVKGYFKFINSTRYANLKTATTPQEYLARIKADGYATSSTYVNTNMSCVNKYDLTKYDNFSEIAQGTEEYNMPTISQGSKGKAVKIWQVILGFTYDNVDGVFGLNTLKYTKEFQQEHGLKADGIVGAKSWAAGLESVN